MVKQSTRTVLEKASSITIQHDDGRLLNDDIKCKCVT